jgi:hypothetical protein
MEVVCRSVSLREARLRCQVVCIFSSYGRENALEASAGLLGPHWHVAAAFLFAAAWQILKGLIG